ncbi:MAG: hypothetical protein PHQ98_02325 [Candidatus ainarchaeum sp.]|nr:hypothetical protein [Candidatus ainarchaeum sp.]
MTHHDTSVEVKQMLNDLNAVKHISPEFNELTSNLEEIIDASHNPAFLGILLYKLVKEKEQTNKIISSLEKRLTNLEQLVSSSSNSHTKEEELLAEPDQHIMQLVAETGQVCASEVKERLSYKNSNAASQRLNKLMREGHLKRLRSGKKVYFILNSRK